MECEDFFRLKLVENKKAWDRLERDGDELPEHRRQALIGFEDSSFDNLNGTQSLLDAAAGNADPDVLFEVFRC